MHIKIADKKTVGDLKKEFHDQLPNLKLEFYSKSHKDMEGSPNDYIIADSKTIGDIRNVHNEADVQFDKSFKVKDIEHLFHDTFGLNVQVFRRSGKLWLQTTRTDDWTLEQQNQEAEESKVS